MYLYYSRSSHPFLSDKQRAVNDLEEIHSKYESTQSELDYELLQVLWNYCIYF